MALPKITTHAANQFTELNPVSHGLMVIPKDACLPDDLAFRDQWLAVLERKDMKLAELIKTPLAIDLADGRRRVLLMIDFTLSRFEQLTRLRKAAMLLLAESPKKMMLWVTDADMARDLIFVTLVNSFHLPARQKKPAVALATIDLFSPLKPADLHPVMVLAKANNLVRELTALAPNELTPATYRQKVRVQAKAHGLSIEEYDIKRLRKMGAGAFCAVAQGSDKEDAAIVHLQYKPSKTLNLPKRQVKHVALVGKGICFDTGGHNLKPARYMAGMHADMNGSAVALAITLAAAEMQLPIVIDCWLAIAQNHISATAYKQNDIVTALDGTTIEIVHTDAEGRLVLADTLTLAIRQKPDLVIDFATLTGSMHVALGNRQSGVFASTSTLAELAVATGASSGERMCMFPLAEDYLPALDSKVADIKQCTLDGEADHILAALFLQRFTNHYPWIHVDLSASRCNEGLGAVASEITGFGVKWGAAFLVHWAK